MKYFNVKKIIKNPEVYKREFEELKSYSKNKHFLRIEECKRCKYLENMILSELTEEGYGEVEIDIALDEYEDYVSKFKNYSLDI